MVNFNLSEEEKNRIRTLHESRRALHGTVVMEQGTTQAPPPGVKPSTGTPQPTQPATSKYKLPEITDDNKYKTFIAIAGTDDVRPSGLLSMADQWFKTNIAAKKGTISQQEYVKGVQSWTSWAGQVETIAKALLSMAAIQGVNSQAFKTVGDDIIVKFLEFYKIAKPYQGTWDDIIGNYVGGMQQLKNGMSNLITTRLNLIK